MKIIKNILNLSLSDFLCEVKNSDLNTFVCDIDLYLHLKMLTDNFEIELLERVMNDIYNYWLDYVLYLYEEKEMSISAINENNREKFKDNWVEEELEKWENFGELIIKQSIIRRITNLDVIKNFESYDNVEDLEQDLLKGSIEEKTYGWEIESLDLSRLNKNGIRIIHNYFDNAISIYVSKTSVDKLMYWAENFRDYDGGFVGGLKKTNQFYRKKVKFTELFKNEYVDMIDLFIQWLNNNGYINKMNQVNVSTTKFARIYYLLREQGIMKSNINNSIAMRTYFCNFGVNVVDHIDFETETPQVTRRLVTSEETRITEMLDISNNEKKKLLSIFKNDNK